MSSVIPPGFRFHPTDEELVDYYLRKKVASRKIEHNIIKDVDLYKIEPWDLQEICKIGTDQEQNDWYFFSHKDKKYPTGTRTNRATTVGFWKATGRDKPIYAKLSLVGMRKTLVYYRGRAPNGQKSDWIMHEYRLETNENAPPQEEGWVVCRVFKKRVPTTRLESDHYKAAAYWYADDDGPLVCHDPTSPIMMTMTAAATPAMAAHHSFPYRSRTDLRATMQQYSHQSVSDLLLSGGVGSIPQLESHDGGVFPLQQLLISPEDILRDEAQMAAAIGDQVTDWRVLDKFVASQLSHDEGKGAGYAADASTSTSSSHADMWK